MAIRATNYPYDVVDRAKDLLPRQHTVPYFGLMGTLTGTQATNAAAITDLMIVPANSNITVTGASCKRGVGGTAASTAPHWGIAHSLAGTGANTVFGTLLFGTAADSTYANFSVTETDVPAGNVVRLVAIAGTTSEETQTIGGLTIEYREDWT
jgi:hypothetical protein